MSLFSVIILLTITIQTICFASPAPLYFNPLPAIQSPSKTESITDALSTDDDDGAQPKWHITVGSGSGKSVEPIEGKSASDDDSKWHVTFGSGSGKSSEPTQDLIDGKWHITFGTKSLQEVDEGQTKSLEEEGKWFVTVGSKIYVLPETIQGKAGDVDSSHNIANNLNGLTFGINAAQPDNSTAV